MKYIKITLILPSDVFFVFRVHQRLSEEAVCVQTDEQPADQRRAAPPTVQEEGKSHSLVLRESCFR